MNKRTLTLSFPWKRESRLSYFSFVIANPLKRMKQSLRTSSFSSVFAKPHKLMKQFLLSSFLSRIRGINIQRESRLSSFLFVIASVAKQSRFLSLRVHFLTVAISILFYFTLPSFAFAEEKIPVFPTAPVEAYTVYGTIALFWLGIIGLIVILKMKLNEIERIQKLGIDEGDKNAPVLE